jgi:hypothetical protein
MTDEKPVTPIKMADPKMSDSQPPKVIESAMVSHYNMVVPPKKKYREL